MIARKRNIRLRTMGVRYLQTQVYYSWFVRKRSSMRKENRMQESTEMRIGYLPKARALCRHEPESNQYVQTINSSYEQHFPYGTMPTDPDKTGHTHLRIHSSSDKGSDHADADSGRRTRRYAEIMITRQSKTTPIRETIGTEIRIRIQTHDTSAVSLHSAYGLTMMSL